MSELGTRFLFQCKANYDNAIRPARKDTSETEGYLTIEEIGKEIIKKDGVESFSGFFREYQYCVNLWTAHIVIQYGDPSDKLLQESLEIIQRYSETPLNKDLAKEEKQWLSNYVSGKKFGCL